MHIIMNGIKDVQERNIARICGKNIKYLRERAKYSQDELALLLNCSEETIGKVERGLQTMRLWRLIRLSDMFHVSLDYLLRGKDYTDLNRVPSYLIKLFNDADMTELEILSDHMELADREIRRKHELEEHVRRTGPSA